MFDAMYTDFVEDIPQSAAADAEGGDGGDAADDDEDMDNTM